MIAPRASLAHLGDGVFRHQHHRGDVDAQGARPRRRDRPRRRCRAGRRSPTLLTRMSSRPQRCYGLRARRRRSPRARSRRPEHHAWLAALLGGSCGRWPRPSPAPCRERDVGAGAGQQDCRGAAVADAVGARSGARHDRYLARETLLRSHCHFVLSSLFPAGSPRSWFRWDPAPAV